MFNVLKRIMNMAGEDGRDLRLSFAYSLLESVMMFVPYMLVFYAIHEVYHHRLSIRVIWTIAVLLVLSVILRTVFRRKVNQLQCTKGCSIFKRKRMEMADHLRKLPMGYFNEGNVGNIGSILATDIIFMEEVAITSLGTIVSAFISICISTAVKFFISPYLGLGYLAVIICGYCSLKILDNLNLEQGKIRQQQFGNLSESVVAFIRGMATVKAYNMMDQSDTDIKNVFQETKEKALIFEEKYFIPRLLVQSAHTVGSGALVCLILFLYWRNLLSFDLCLDMMIFMFVTLNPLKVFEAAIPRLRILSAGLDRFDKVMAAPVILDSGLGTRIGDNTIEFRNVSFAYGEKAVLKDINFQLQEHSFTALVGHSGSGKSTIANLIARFWDIREGQILIGGKDIKEVTLDALLSRLSVVFQDVYLFSDTIYNNIAFGKEGADRDEVIEASKKARCHEFIMNLEHGYDTWVGEGGSTLSGGEKQRISIARAILKDAPIVLLDEATSGIDPENEKFVQDAFGELVKSKTLIVIAHKLSSVKRADQILVLEAGRIVERGTHEELLQRKKGMYAGMYSYYNS